MNYKVYILTSPNNKNDIKYVGMTEKSLKHRLAKHIIPSKNKGKSKRTKWILSLSQAPKIFLLEAFDNKKEALEAEIFWIEQFRQFKYVLVNSNDFIGYVTTKRLKADKYSLTGKLLEKNVDVIKFLKGKKNSGNISRSIKRGTTANGFRWTYPDEKLKEIFKFEPSTGKYIVKTKKVYKYRLTGEYICSYLGARRATKFNYRNISQVCKGDKKSHAGYRWSYDKVKKLPKEEKKYKKGKHILKYDKDFNFIQEYVSAQHVVDEHNGFIKSSLNDCANRRRKLDGKYSLYKGFIWRFKV